MPKHDLLKIFQYKFHLTYDEVQELKAKLRPFVETHQVDIKDEEILKRTVLFSILHFYEKLGQESVIRFAGTLKVTLKPHDALCLYMAHVKQWIVLDEFELLTDNIHQHLVSGGSGWIPETKKLKRKSRHQRLLGQ